LPRRNEGGPNFDPPAPPAAFGLYMACRIGKVKMHEIISPVLYFLFFASIPAMLITTYYPPLALWLPSVLGYVR